MINVNYSAETNETNTATGTSDLEVSGRQRTAPESRNISILNNHNQSNETIIPYHTEDYVHNIKKSSIQEDNSEISAMMCNPDVVISEVNEVNTHGQEKTALFWRTLTFWQRASLNEEGEVSDRIGDILESDVGHVSEELNQTDVIIESSPADHESSPLKKPFINNPTTIVTEHIAQSTVIKDGETNTIISSNQDIVSNEEAIKFTNDDPDDERRGSIWNITRRVSYLQFLQPKADDMIETFVPNKLSQVLDTNQQVITNANATQPTITDINKSENEQQSNWWSPWKWAVSRKSTLNQDEAASDLGPAVVEDELLKLQRKEVSNQIKLQSYGIPKAVIWGSYYHEGDGNCNVQITGSYKKPVVMKHLPESVFEITEKGFQKKKETEQGDLDIIESIVLPDIRWNYRNLTWRTKCRITLSKIPKLDSIFRPQKHLYMDASLTKKKKGNPKPLKKAVVISFHGFLPQKIVRNIIGEPTGNAEEMSKNAVDELKRWSAINNIDLDINIVNIEGHGKIFERVNGCLTFLDNCMDTIKSCDYLLCVANSHNVPLAIHTISKLVTSGYLDEVEKLGLVGLAGLCMGPIPEIESRISARGSVGQDNEIISELFDLEDPESLQGKEIIRSMKILIKKNFKVTFIGALNDCFSPLYSSLGLNISHPNIYRAIYVDKENHQPDFLVSLFNLILTIKNLNYKDHGLLIELSNFFSGSIAEGGHSKLMKNKYCYRVGINNMLNTCNLFYEQSMVEELTNAKEFTSNSYHIPWCLRGLLEELEILQKHFDAKQILQQLYQEFKSWESHDQKSKELRYCMEAFDNVLNEDFGL